MLASGVDDSPMMPTPMNDVITRRSGLASRSAAMEPMWSKSVWVSQVQRRSS